MFARQRSFVSSHLRVASLMLGTSALALLAAPAFAQNATDSDSAGSVESVVVTGSRIVQPGFTAPTPVQAVTGLVMDKVALTMGDALATLPSVVPTTGATQTNSGVGAG